MENESLKEIAIKSVKYYENNWLSPEFTEHTRRESVVDCSAYFYAYAVKILQNGAVKRTRDEAEELIPSLLASVSKSLTEGMKMDVISSYNNHYLSFLDMFKEGLDYGENSKEGIVAILDASAKIIISAILWIENN